MGSGIYVIENLITHRVYVGSTASISRRWRDHLIALERQLHYNKFLQRAWIKYGTENFCFWILEYVRDKSQLFTREQFFLDAFQNYPYGIYNTCLEAGNPSRRGFPLSIETKQKLRLAMKGKSPWNKDTKGKPPSKQTRLKISQTLLGRKHSEEALQKMCGKVVSKTTREKLSASVSGFKHSEEARRKMREAKRKLGV